jgi:lipoic acid synthetase
MMLIRFETVRLWLETVEAIRRMNPGTTLETLIPDFRIQNDRIEANPEVVSHNVGNSAN